MDTVLFQDDATRPHSLTLHHLEEITNGFSKERLIGTGSHGRVYKGVKKDGEVIAVKLLYDMLTFGSDEYFVNIVENLLNLRHQNIVRLVGYCYEVKYEYVPYKGQMVLAGRHYRALCYEYVPYGCVDKYLSDESTGLDWFIRYKIVKGTCEGLNYLHHGFESPHFHLNIKPSNILLDKNMVPKLTDIDIFKFFHEDETDKTTDSIGTLGYVPPEYINHNLVSNKFDIFSLGVVLVNIISGPEGYSRCVDMTNQEFIEIVCKNWRSRLQSIFRGSTLDVYCEQVKRCIEIAMFCVEADRYKRPNIVDIIYKLNETETREGFDDRQVWRMSFQELKTITNDFSREIGKGAFGVVYEGRLTNGDVVAVKRLNCHHHPGNQLKQIESEEHLKNLEHKNIVQLIGYCHETRQVPVRISEKTEEYKLIDVTESLLCYEFLPNGSLEDKMWKDKSSRLDWQTRYSVIEGICEGLHYLHQGCQNAPIVHRDLKPGNILLDDGMVPKLGDFGLSRIVPKTRAHLTTAVGSSGYMAPETFRDTKLSEITPKSDIYSLGVLILEIVTGEKCPNEEYSGKCYIEKVREDRKQNSYVVSRYHSLEDRFLPQVESWISIGLRCAEELPERRPTTEHIMHFIETESAKSADASDGQVSKMSFKELEDITNKFSVQHGESIFGSVFEGTRVDGDEIVVIKLKEHKSLSQTQFKSEVNRMRFEHKNILQLKGYCSETERLLCYEFLRNGSLDRKNFSDPSRTELDWEARYKIIQDMCQVLKYLHLECGYVHMDIRPDTIWLDDQMAPKIGFCGLSRLFTADPIQIHNTEVLVPGSYFAPDLITMTNMSTDIYSLGILIIEIVTGEKCHSSDNGSTVASVHQSWLKDSHIAITYPSLDAICIQQVKGCITIGGRCTETSPDKRPTAGEIVTMLEEQCTKKPGFWNALCSGICPMEQL